MTVYTCTDLFDCCDCGGEGCGCNGCFSCNACEACQNDDEKNCIQIEHLPEPNTMITTQAELERHKTYSLSDCISYPDRYQITEEQREQLVALFGKYCQDKTKRRLSSLLRYPSTLSNYGIYGRVEIAPRVSYCAGQDYPAEIRAVRELILKG